MARTNDGDWERLILVLLIGVGAVALYYTDAGRGEENNATLLPDSVEGRIDLIVTVLNKRFGRRWVNRGLDALRFFLEKTLPAEVVALVNAIYRVELLSKTVRMDGNVKRQQAVAFLR
jgi:hypothetical protein